MQTNQQDDSNKSGAERIAGIDSLRWICALWVVLFHDNAPKLEWLIDRSHGWARALGALYDVLFCGPAAVIVFFVISGFCIHYPFVERPVEAGKFLLRRYLRIGIPAFVAIVCSVFFPDGTRDMWRLLLWSLYCEIVYYSLYPLLNPMARRIGWNSLIVGAFFILIVFMMFTNGISDLMYARIDIWDPVLGLPCWLLGCKVADLARQGRQGRRMSLLSHKGLWRLGAWVLSSLSFGLMLHADISFKISLSIFALYVAFWLWSETAADGGTAFPRWLEFAGGASYSLYLTHPLSARLYQVIAPGCAGAKCHLLSWAGQLSFILLMSALFWLFVENPAHRFARRLGR